MVCPIKMKIPRVEGSIDCMAFLLGQMGEPVSQSGFIDPELLGELGGAAGPEACTYEVIEGDQAACGFFTDIGLNGGRLAADMATFDVDELVGEGAAALGLQLARSHPDLRPVGGAENALRQPVGPDEVDVEEGAQGPPGMPHAREDTCGHMRLAIRSGFGQRRGR